MQSPSCGAPNRRWAFPIEIIPGREEARLIYLGVVHSLPQSSTNRMVVDIGGGSTEFIIGNKMKPKAMESLYMGCVSYTSRYFPDGRIDKKGFRQAELAARGQVQTIATRFEKEGWKEAVGSSGTARSIAEILLKNGQAERGITATGLAWLREQLRRRGRRPEALDRSGFAKTGSRWWPVAWPSCRACSPSLRSST